MLSEPSPPTDTDAKECDVAVSQVTARILITNAASKRSKLAVLAHEYFIGAAEVSIIFVKRSLRDNLYDKNLDKRKIGPSGQKKTRALEDVIIKQG
jgi:hypothetical protein